ncbi:MAG: hypothetical protein CVU89_16150 [Firmicutes bacterium HGW-Firmicutes-14]|nr:MAG: hypothetical protein CVU89_16150 [Firmicutes bacterium HGW-Firmicutes-14]
MAVRRSAITCLLIIMLTLFSGCARDGQDNQEYYGIYGSAGPWKVGIVKGAADKTPSGLNEAVAAGISKIIKDYDAEYTVLDQGDLVNNEECLRYLAENGYNLVIAVGAGMEESLAKIAPDYPDVSFIIFDGEVEQDNVSSVKITEEEGAFLAGVAAAAFTKSNMVGYVGGAMTDHTMEQGFARGVQYVNITEGKKVKVYVSYAGVTEKAAGDSERGKQLAANMYWSGVDVVYSGPGSLGSGAAKAAAENRSIAFVNDASLVNTMPWNVYGSVIKKPEEVVYALAKKALGGEFAAGRAGFGLTHGAVDFILSQAVPEDTAGKLNRIKDQIKKGEIKPYAIEIPVGLVTDMKELPVDRNRPPAGAQPGTGNSGRTGGGSNSSGGSTGGSSNGGTAGSGENTGGTTTGPSTGTNTGEAADNPGNDDSAGGSETTDGSGTDGTTGGSNGNGTAGDSGSGDTTDPLPQDIGST